MRRIYKYVINPKESFTHTIDMPVRAKILSVDKQDEHICLWAIVDPDVREEYRTFQIIGTGWNATFAGLIYLGTVQMDDGLVWHVFENGWAE